MRESEVVRAERQEQLALADAQAYSTRLVGQRRRLVEDWPDREECEL